MKAFQVVVTVIVPVSVSRLAILPEEVVMVPALTVTAPSVALFQLLLSGEYWTESEVTSRSSSVIVVVKVTVVEVFWEAVKAVVVGRVLDWIRLKSPVPPL